MKNRLFIFYFLFLVSMLFAGEKTKKPRCHNKEASFVAEALYDLGAGGGLLVNSLGRGVAILTSDLYAKLFCFSSPTAKRSINMVLSPCAPVEPCCPIEERPTTVVCTPNQVGIPPSNLQGVNITPSNIAPLGSPSKTSPSCGSKTTPSCGSGVVYWCGTVPSHGKCITICPNCPHAPGHNPNEEYCTVWKCTKYCPLVEVKGPPCTSTWIFSPCCFGYGNPANQAIEKIKGDTTIGVGQTPCTDKERQGIPFEVFLPTIDEPCGKTKKGGGLYFPFGLPAGATVTMNANGTWTITLSNGEEFLIPVYSSCGHYITGYKETCTYSGKVPSCCSVEDVIVVPDCAGGWTVQYACPFPWPCTGCGPQAITPPRGDNAGANPQLPPSVPEFPTAPHESSSESKSVPDDGFVIK